MSVVALIAMWTVAVVLATVAFVGQDPVPTCYEDSIVLGDRCVPLDHLGDAIPDLRGVEQSGHRLST